MTEQEKQARRSRWGAMYQHVVATVAAAGIVAGAGTLIAVKENQATTNVRLSAIEVQLWGDKADVKERMTMADARIGAIEQRVQAIEAGRGFARGFVPQ